MLQGVIFDHDGTLVDSERKHYLLWVQLLAEYGCDFPEDEYKAHLAGVPTHFNAEYLVAHYPLPLSAEELFAKRELLTLGAFGKDACPLIPDAQTLVEWVAARSLKMAIATGASALEVQPTLTQHGFAQYFPIVATREDVTHAKPAPDVYLHALQQMQLDADACIAIEDSPTGLRSALAAGLPCIVVLNEYSRGLDFSGATVVVNSMQAAQQWLTEHYGL
ncbi:HAD family phosphatase [uncultured Gilvimarinus sp.]|uniref:HAD family hydrolase n=1 Tax=uncultured Gilvimarinus sp. TaxID=1689143 RepID=UPI0030EBE459|tara:strand:- start:977 stop:1636 length:660 start_codon:yes stop_codon:yes gene_type:complete